MKLKVHNLRIYQFDPVIMHFSGHYGYIRQSLGHDFIYTYTLMVMNFLVVQFSSHDVTLVFLGVS